MNQYKTTEVEQVKQKSKHRTERIIKKTFVIHTHTNIYTYTHTHTHTHIYLSSHHHLLPARCTGQLPIISQPQTHPSYTPFYTWCLDSENYIS